MLSKNFLSRLVLTRYPSSLNFSTSSSSSNKVEEAKRKEENSEKPVRLFASVCIERMPIITCDMNNIEKRYSDLINQINVKKSLLSNHELRHLKDLERVEKKKKNPNAIDESGELVIETAVDFEDKCLKQLKAFKFAERRIGSQFQDDQVRSQYLKNIDHILDKKLILLTKSNDNWELPKIEWTPGDHSLRNSAERLVSSLNKYLNVQFLGNAPVGVYKSQTTDKFVDKLYFFKAQYKSGADQLASSDLEFVWIRKDELKNFIKNDNKYLNCLDNFILDF